MNIFMLAICMGKTIVGLGKNKVDTFSARLQPLLFGQHLGFWTWEKAVVGGAGCWTSFVGLVLTVHT